MAEVCKRFWSWILVKILNLKFGQKEGVKKSFTLNSTLAEFYGFLGHFGYGPFGGNKAFILNGIRTYVWTELIIMSSSQKSRKKSSLRCYNASRQKNIFIFFMNSLCGKHKHKHKHKNGFIPHFSSDLKQHSTIWSIDTNVCVCMPGFCCSSIAKLPY